jgi:hypothetical protein
MSEYILINWVISMNPSLYGVFFSFFYFTSPRTNLGSVNMCTSLTLTILRTNGGRGFMALGARYLQYIVNLGSEVASLGKL